MKKIFLPLSVIAALTISSCCSNCEKPDETETAVVEKEEICFYNFDNTTIPSVKWTAFKTDAKVGVGGAFDKVNVKAGEKSTKITEVLEGINFTIPTGSTNTNNPERDTKIVNSFFGAMQATDIIIGQVSSAEGNNESGTCNFYLIINDIEKPVTLAYTVTDNHIVLTGEIDVNNWNGSEALASLNTVCSDLHKGESGESILWPNVELVIEATLTKECH